MNIAVLWSGHARTFAKCLPNISWMVLRHFKGADHFVSTVKDEDSPSFELLRQHFPLVQVEIEAVNEQPQIPLPAGCPANWEQGRHYTHEPYAISVPPQHVLAQLWQLNECWALFERTKRKEYDIVIRCRPDLWFHSFAPPPSGASGAFVPNWGEFGGVNDRFAIMTQAAAREYFGTFNKIDALWEMGCPIHPESLVAASLEHGGVLVSRLPRCEFSCLRKSGEMRPPEVSVIDLLHSQAR
jgi:hypothetical protein